MSLSPIKMENMSAVPLWQRWLAPQELVKDKERAGKIQILDTQLFAEEIASIYSRKQTKSEQRAALLALSKDRLLEGRETLEAGLMRDRDGAVYVGAHAILIDRLIGGLVVCRENYVFATKARFALMAVGGYGRGELAPLSDIDLLFVMPQRHKKCDSEFVEFILYLLWDLGLMVGHASRTVHQNITAASEDITICTSLLEMRSIAGAAEVSEQMVSTFKHWVAKQSAGYFVEAKLAERDQRHARFGGTRYAVEPNVKDGKGGLRDLHTLFWISKYAYRLDHVRGVLGAGILRTSEARAFASSQRFLWTVRCFLHQHHGREDDRLTFDAQMQLAPLMGFADRSGCGVLSGL